MTKPSVLMIVSRYRGFGGHEIVINNLCKGLAEIGHNVAIGAFTFDKMPPSEIHAMKLKRFHPREWLHNSSFDIYHSHQTQINYYALFSRKPFVFHFHGASNIIQELNVRLSMTLSRRKISKTICVSGSCLKQLHRITNCDAEIVFNGVDTVSLNPKLPTSYIKGNPQLLFVGNLYPHKNVSKLILIMNEIIRKYPKANLQIVGSGQQYQKIESLIYEHGLGDHIELVGNCSGDQLRHRLSSCDIYLSASKWEMFGLPVLEAMACGKPVLLSDIPAHKELVDFSEGGSLFSPDNVTEFTEKLDNLYRNRYSIGNKGRKFAEKCDWKVACENLSNIYSNL